jgi:N6-adenosine-specific RNA methylase IME4
MIKIDPELKALIPPLAPEEYAQLEANLIADGCRDPLVVWGDILLDGHNRFEICTRLSIGYKTEPAPPFVRSREEAILWMEENQIGRRNLSDDQRSVIADSIRERRSEAVVNAATATARKAKTSIVSDNVSESETQLNKDQRAIEAADLLPARKPKTDTRAAVAKEFAIPERKLRTAQEVKKSSPELLQKVRDGQISMAEAKRTIKRAEVVSKLEDVAAVEAKELAGVYDVIVIDPPWPMEKIERDERQNQVAFEYPTMQEAELAEMKMPAADDCHLWLWTTHKFLPMAFRLLDAWQFKYVCTFVWHKPGGFQPFGLPQYNCEFALYARKGTPQFIDTKAFPVCFDAPRGAHSEKPEGFYDVVRRVTAGRRIDIFNRREITGFDVWGKEAAK